MKILFKKLNSDYRHYICIGITLFFIIFGVLYFRFALPRLWETIIDLYTSSWYYIAEMFEFEFTGKVTITEFTKQPFEPIIPLPRTPEGWKKLWILYWDKFFTKQNISLYNQLIGKFIYYFSKVVLLVLPLIVTIDLMLSTPGETNNDYNKDSKSLIYYKKNIQSKIIIPVRNWILNFIDFVKNNKIYYNICVFMICYSFNIISIIIELLSFYIYFVASFEFKSILIMILKLMADLSVCIKFIPKPIWTIIIILTIDYLRKEYAYSKLMHMEKRDRGFINERPIVTMVCGTMGKKKTTMITDMALSQEIMFRNKAFEIIIESDLKFPYFPWINFENEIKEAIKSHKIYNLSTCEVFINEKYNVFKDNKCDENIFGYNYTKYGLSYDSKLNIIDIWEVLHNYTKAYFIYIIESSLLVSNYSIRVDNVLTDKGNFPLWNTNLFKRDSKVLDAISRHAHIVDYDSLRLGKKVIQNNPMKDSFEFGVVNLTEIGKERGNALELQAIKKNDDGTNQKNDLFNSWLKMCRHSATVDNFPFIKIITDEQRPESWGADARDLCEIVNIDECEDIGLTMPLFSFEDLFITLFLKHFKKNFYNYRHERADNNLLMYLYHSVASRLYNYQKRIYNRFGYFKMHLNVEAGIQDGNLMHKKYFLMCKKIYSKRFSTDCFSDYFKEKTLRSEYGLNDLPEFATEKASFEEMKKENSYFFNDLTKLRK